MLSVQDLQDLSANGEAWCLRRRPVVRHRRTGGLGALPAPTGLDPITYGTRYASQLKEVFLPILVDLYRRGAQPAEVQSQVALVMAREGIPTTMAGPTLYWFSAIQDLAPLAQAMVRYRDRVKELEPVFPAWMSDQDRQPYRDQYLVALARGPTEIYGLHPPDILNKLVELKNSSDVRRGNITRANEIGRLNLAVFAILDAQQLRMLKKRIEQVYSASTPMRETLTSVPWPHQWINEFVMEIDPVNYPVPGAFLRDIHLWDFQALMDAGYFKNPKSIMEHDLAMWFLTNVDIMSKYFQKKLEYWLGQQEGKAKAGFVPAMMSFVNGVLFVAGFAVSFLLPGVAELITSAIKSGFAVLRASIAGQNQIEMASKVLTLVGTTSRAFEVFTQWIRERLPVPPRPQGFIIRIEGRDVGDALTMADAIKIAMANSQPGDRIEFEHRDTGVVVLELRTSDSMVEVSGPMEQKVRAMTKQELHDTVTAAEQKLAAEKPGFPWWVLIPIGGAAALAIR